ncbi:replicative DNA helicase [Deinococcus multiflagellatus]|uniref:DNA 5'-3' helicase n=1 Tax=Deinococcus multiflagellatus TaxID=1656887 RepID=A0ABW1ZGU9_9DEIO
MLLDNDALTNTAVSQLQPADFYQAKHRLIWAAVPALRDARTQDGQPGPVDLITLSAELTRRGQLDEAGGLTYLMGLADQVPTAVYAEHYARIVLEKATLRGKIAAAGKLMQACYDQAVPLEEIDAMTALIPNLTRFDSGLERVGDTVRAVLEQAAQGTGPNGAPTGLKDLDELMGGLEPGRLYVLAARPAMGKTAAAFQMAVHVARVRGRVLGFSLEMPTEEITARLLCSEARVDLKRFSESRRGQGNLNDRDWERLTHAGAHLDGLRLDMLAKPGLKLQELLDAVRQAHRDEPLSLFVLDYLQLVQVSGRAGRTPCSA